MLLPDVFKAFDQLKVLVIGDVMLDSYTFGRVDRISPEAPVPVLVAQRRDCRLGGAGNVLLNIQALGAEPIACSVVGKDTYGKELCDLLEQRGLSTEGIIHSSDRITTIKERIIAGSQQIVRIDTETDKSILPSEREALLNKVYELAEGCHVIIFEDYDKGVITAELIEEVVVFARDKGIPTVVDPKKRNFLHYHGTTLFKPNLKELREGLNISLDIRNRSELEAAAGQLKDRLNLEGTLITLSENGVYIDYQEQRHHLSAHIRQIADVSGAGDTVISIAACCVALGLSPERIAGLSNLGGGLVCEEIGVVPVNKARLLEEALKENL
ncbi:MAG: bifunctional ADP-heptose synthase [Siphonobacter sp.]